jgi:hypothetical protein
VSADIRPVWYTHSNQMPRFSPLSAPAPEACGALDPIGGSAPTLTTSNTDDITAGDLTWTGWGKPTAIGKGSALIDLCAYQDCANGSYTTVPIEVVTGSQAGRECSKAVISSTWRRVRPMSSRPSMRRQRV